MASILTFRPPPVAAAAGGDTLIYTVPAGFHVRLRRSVCTVAGALGTFILYVVTPAPLAARLIQVVTTAAPQLLEDPGDVVLEAGDSVHAFTAAGQTANVWLSGTLYED